MGKQYTPQTWDDEQLLGDPRYDIRTDGGDPIDTNVQISLATGVAQAGTAVTAERMEYIEDGVDMLDTIVNQDGVRFLQVDDGGGETALEVGAVLDGQALVRMGSAIVGGRELLTANRTYYVRTDGNDSNTGLANNSGGAFLTIQKAVDVVAALDISIYNVTISVGAGTYTSRVNLKSPVGTGTCTLSGGGVATISVTSNHAVYAENTTWSITGFTITQTGTGLQSGIYVTNSNITISNMIFGSCFLGHITIIKQGSITLSGAIEITGGASRHIYARGPAIVEGGPAYTLTGTPSFGNDFIECVYSIVRFSGASFSGSATGRKYSVSYNGVLISGGATIPGSTAGVTSTGGQYA